VKRIIQWEDITHPMSKIRSQRVSRGVHEISSNAPQQSRHEALSSEVMTHRVQNLSDQQSHLRGYAPAKKNNHHISNMMDIVLKDLLVFGSALLVVSAFLYLIL
jgi:hypothetical protein